MEKIFEAVMADIPNLVLKIYIYQEIQLTQQTPNSINTKNHIKTYLNQIAESQ